ncbi:hypothetical protein [Streptomyces kaniharaensis]|uniref:hypothetical protein n=1 Tax=Streptomyces kaniharaensis TaxID=212423 RepID=UPI001296849A|nr:hypothetical protein [Streptomyces kaniharaensis]
MPTAAYYFGDLDAAGLRIAASAATTAENLIATRQRIPQERVGLRALRADPALLLQAVG